jgi:hypothetical protein
MWHALGAIPGYLWLLAGVALGWAARPVAGWLVDVAVTVAAVAADTTRDFGRFLGRAVLALLIIAGLLTVLAALAL